MYNFFLLYFVTNCDRIQIKSSIMYLKKKLRSKLLRTRIIKWFFPCSEIEIPWFIVTIIWTEILNDKTNDNQVFFMIFFKTSVLHVKYVEKAKMTICFAVLFNFNSRKILLKKDYREFDSFSKINDQHWKNTLSELKIISKNILEDLLELKYFLE